MLKGLSCRMPGLSCKDGDGSEQALYESARKEESKMITFKTNVKAKTCYGKNHELARARTTRALLAYCALPRLLLGLSVLLSVGTGLVAADEVTDWNQIMLEATLTPPA